MHAVQLLDVHVEGCQRSGDGGEHPRILHTGASVLRIGIRLKEIEIKAALSVERADREKRWHVEIL